MLQAGYDLFNAHGQRSARHMHEIHNLLIMHAASAYRPGGIGIFALQQGDLPFGGERDRGRFAVRTQRQTRSYFGPGTMTAPITKDSLAFSLGNLSYVDASYDEQPAPPLTSPKHSVLGWLRQWRQRRQIVAELALMSDRELADIGLSRADLPRVFDPAFAADHGRGRDYIAY